MGHVMTFYFVYQNTKVIACDHALGTDVATPTTSTLIIGMVGYSHRHTHTHSSVTDENYFYS